MSEPSWNLPPLGGNPSTRRQGTTPGSFANPPDIGGARAFAFKEIRRHDERHRAEVQPLEPAIVIQCGLTVPVEPPELPAVREGGEAEPL